MTLEVSLTNKPVDDLASLLRIDLKAMQVEAARNLVERITAPPASPEPSSVLKALLARAGLVPAQDKFAA